MFKITEKITKNIRKVQNSWSQSWKSLKIWKSLIKKPWFNAKFKQRKKVWKSQNNMKKFQLSTEDFFPVPPKECKCGFKICVLQYNTEREEKQM